MSTMEMPACFALLLVMINLALCLSADDRRVAHVISRPSIETLAGSGLPSRCSASTRLTRPC
jgi:hypothetical protein